MGLFWPILSVPKTSFYCQKIRSETSFTVFILKQYRKNYQPSKRIVVWPQNQWVWLCEYCASWQMEDIHQTRWLPDPKPSENHWKNWCPTKLILPLYRFKEYTIASVYLCLCVFQSTVIVSLWQWFKYSIRNSYNAYFSFLSPEVGKIFLELTWWP